MKFALVSLAATLATSLSVPLEKRSPGQVTIRSLTYGGNGCPQGSVSQNFNADGTAFTLLFDSYVASVGPTVPITESRKACQLNIGLNIPQGWQYSIGTIDYRGYMSLDAGISATQSATYYFQGECRLDTPFVGPANRDYTLRDQFPLETLVWSSCRQSANLNIKSAIAVRGNGRGQGLMTTDSIDGKIAQIYGLRWRRC